MTSEHKTDDQLLEQYARDIGIPENCLTVESLIKSHQYLRELNLERNDVKLNAYTEGFESGKAHGLLHVTHYDYISMKDLRSMSIQDLCELIQEWNEDNERNCS